ncbi:hypothetical protein [Streptomyces formicae]|uniref:Uncharacterized protein n=1 Tax=Streptomyces formicae TaxID=1616117 RepID=A0A291QMY4_9ACTN|nr:hypothetical protein [Streptomyces formicae]ATL32887.1 hypothetical protein KY5_7869 [Streptomyces formicae]
MGVNNRESGERAEVSEEQVTEAKARAARLLLAFRHGNQLAYDALVEEFGTDERTIDLVSMLCWIANEGVRKAYLPEAGDRVLRHMVRRADVGDRDVLTEDGAGPDVAELIEAVAAEDVKAVQEIVRGTPDTTFLLGRFVLAFAMLLPDIPRPVLREVVRELREQ